MDSVLSSSLGHWGPGARRGHCNGASPRRPMRRGRHRSVTTCHLSVMAPSSGSAWMAPWFLRITSSAATPTTSPGRPSRPTTVSTRRPWSKRCSRRGRMPIGRSGIWTPPHLDRPDFVRSVQRMACSPRLLRRRIETPPDFQQTTAIPIPRSMMHGRCGGRASSRLGQITPASRPRRRRRRPESRGRPGR